jgi:cytidylate kinase
MLVAIDGPAGAGKSAAARELAHRLGIPYLDTGAMYRAVALLAQASGLKAPFSEQSAHRLAELAAELALSFCGPAHAQNVMLAGEDVTEALRSPEISELSSQVSAVPEVRRELVRRQRELAATTGGVVEGRDIGTVVFPDATVKFFLTATPEVRAQRRFEELRRRGVAVAWEEVLGKQRERDRRDSTRSDSPLLPATDAIVVDTSGMTLAAVVEVLLKRLRLALDSVGSGAL